MFVREVMKTHVVTTTPDATVSQVVDLMDIYHVHAVTVVNADGQLCGILTERDVVRVVFGSVAGGEKASGTVPRVRSCLSLPVLSVADTDDAAVAAQLLISKDVPCLPVLGDAGAVVGTIDLVDVLQAHFEGALSL